MLVIWIQGSQRGTLKMNSVFSELFGVFGLQAGHLVMLLLTLMTVEMRVMQFVNWMARMVGGLSFLTTREVEVVAVEVAVVALVVLI